MGDISQPINPIFQDPEEAMGNFYFLMFSADPTKDRVKIWVDDGKIRLTMKRDKFYKVIEKLIDFETSQIVHEACTTYGCFYMLDRIKKSVEKLHAGAEHKHMNPAKDFMDIHDLMTCKTDSLEKQYSESLEDWADKGFKQSWLNKRKNKSDIENRLV